MNRRQLFTGAAAGALTLTAAGCSNFLGTGFGIQVNPGGSVQILLPDSVNQFVQKIVAGAAKYIPTVETIAQEAAALFGPAYSTIVTIGSNAINTVISALQRLTAPPPSAPTTTTTTKAIYVHRRLTGGTLTKKATLDAQVIGMTAQGVVVYGVR